jgi:hypothetical protein
MVLDDVAGPAMAGRIGWYRFGGARTAAGVAAFRRRRGLSLLAVSVEISLYWKCVALGGIFIDEKSLQNPHIHPLDEKNGADGR